MTTRVNVQPTAREREVLVLLAEGHNFPEIGRLLHIVPHAASKRLQQLRVRAGCRTTWQLIALAAVRGWMVRP